MAQVPYNPVPAPAEPVTARGPEFNPPPEAFGVNIGRAITQFGQTTGQVGNELFQTAMQIQGLKNETTARESAISAGQEMALKQKDYELRPDKFNSDVMMGHLKDLNDIRQKYRANLNPMAARLYDAEAANLQNSFTRYSTVLAGRALQQYSTDTAKAQIELNRRGSVDVWDDNEVEEKLARDESSLRTLATQSEIPWSPERLEAERVKERQNLRVQQLRGQADQDVDRAFGTFDKVVKNKELDPEQENHIREYLWEQNRTQNGPALAKAIYDPNKTIEQMDKDFNDKVDQYSHGDPKFKTSAWQTYKAIVGNNRWEEQQEVFKAEQRLMKIVQSGKYTTQAQIEADPQVGPQAKADLGTVAGTSFDLPGKLNTFNHQRNLVTNQTNYNTLLGMATSQDPKLRQEFLKKDLYTENLSNGDLGKLLIKREHMLGGDHGLDPQVRTAYQNLRQLYGDAVPSPNAGNRYAEFLGLIHGDLEEWQAKEMPLPTTTEDYKKFGQGIMNKVPGTGYLWDDPIYKATPTKEFRAHYRAQGWDDRAINLQYRRSLAAQTFNKLFSGGDSGGSQ